MVRIVAASAVSLLLAASGPVLAAGQAVKVKPHLHLSNGQTVTLSASGFAPSETVYIAECNANVAPDGEAACDLGTFLTVTTNRKGRLPPLPFTLVTGPIGNGTCGTGKADRKCYMAVTNTALTEYAFAPIVFMAP